MFAYVCACVGRGVRLFLIYHLYIPAFFFFFFLSYFTTVTKTEKKGRKIYMCARAAAAPHRNIHKHFLVIYLYALMLAGPEKRRNSFFFRPAYTCVHRSTIEWKGEEKKKKDLSWFGGGSANKQTNIQNTTMPPSSYDLLVSQYYIPYAVFSPSRYSDTKNNRFFFSRRFNWPLRIAEIPSKSSVDSLTAEYERGD